MSESSGHKFNQASSALYRDQLLTLGDLEVFKREFFSELKTYLQENAGGQSKQWLRSREVRNLLGISAGTLQNLRITGVLPYSKIGNIIMYRYRDIAAILEGSNTAQ
jgi:hypothetical protein